MLRASLHKRYWDRGSKQAVQLHFSQIRNCIKLYQIKKYPRAVSDILVQSFSACAFSRTVVANARLNVKYTGSGYPGQSPEPETHVKSD